METRCENCGAIVKGDEHFCGECGFPQHGTEDEKSTFHRRILRKKEVVKDAQKRVKNVQILLYILAGINVVVGSIYTFGADESLFVDGLASLVTGLVFIGCAVWVNKQPLTGILAAFVFWIVLQLLTAVLLPESIFRGILIKIIIIGVFVKGINSAKDAAKYSEQLASMKAK